MDQIIHSLLETDMYKLSMGQAIYHHFSDYKQPGALSAETKMYILLRKWQKRSAGRLSCIEVCVSPKTNWHTLIILNG